MRRKEHLIGIAFGVALLAVLATGGPHAAVRSAQPQSAIAETPSYPPIDEINSCRLPLVGRQDVVRALGFVPEDPSPSNPAYLGCVYRAAERLHPGGLLVVSASAGFASPSPAGRIRPVEGIGDDALFTPRANRDFHRVPGPAGATSMLQVRVGDLILRFLAGRSDGAYRAYPLPALRQLAAAALTARAWS